METQPPPRRHSCVTRGHRSFVARIAAGEEVKLLLGPENVICSRADSQSAPVRESELGRVHTLLPTAIWNWRFLYAAIPLLLFPLARRMINPLCCFGPVSIIRKVNGSCANAADENDENLLNGLSLI